MPLIARSTPALIGVLVFGLLASSALASAAGAGRALWTSAQARQWSQRAGWLVGSNFIPSTAINELEMWQADTFDPWGHQYQFQQASRSDGTMYILVTTTAPDQTQISQFGIGPNARPRN